ncbi:hypothetical protein PSP20601_05419 [Pandoraea sputorum]|nr:hypothetical protein PSP20601_05419 [Pandoraea sputorum]
MCRGASQDDSRPSNEANGGFRAVRRRCERAPGARRYRVRLADTVECRRIRPLRDASILWTGPLILGVPGRVLGDKRDPKKRASRPRGAASILWTRALVPAARAPTASETPTRTRVTGPAHQGPRHLAVRPRGPRAVCLGTAPRAQRRKQPPPCSPRRHSNAPRYRVGQWRRRALKSHQPPLSERLMADGMTFKQVRKPKQAAIYSALTANLSGLAGVCTSSGAASNMRPNAFRSQKRPLGTAHTQRRGLASAV